MGWIRAKAVRCYALAVTQPAPFHSYTFRDYLDLEAAANVKHEALS